MSVAVGESAPGSLDRLVARASRPTLVLLAPGQEYDAASADVTVARIGDPVPQDRWAAVVLAVADRSALRRLASRAVGAGRARAVVCRLSAATTPVLPEVRPEWAEPTDVEAHLAGGVAVTRIRFASPVPVAEVVAALARDAGPATAGGADGLVVGWADLPPDEKVPADVVWGDARDAPVSEVTGRAPVALEESGLGPVDEAVFNPTGFRRDSTTELMEVAAGAVDERTLREVRDAEVVRLLPTADPLATARAAAALAMAGVPVTADLDAEAAVLLGDGLAPLLTRPPGLAGGHQDRALRREEWSVRLRRAALTAHSTLAWRDRAAAAAAAPRPRPTTVSVLLATRRPDLLEFALSQVARQRLSAPIGGEIELVLAAHGFTPDPAVLARGWGDRPLTVLTPEESTVFGEVLALASQAAGGDVVVKMDDDDWYGPEVVSDLLWARRWSGADLVGMPAEMVHLERIDLTVRRRGPTECPALVVAGGTMLIGRDRLREIGGWRPVTRHVDAHLLAAVRRAGGSVYRTQGLGYLLRRGASGHTWAADDGYFLARRSVAAQWRGFRPSALVEDDHESHEGV